MSGAVEVTEGDTVWVPVRINHIDGSRRAVYVSAHQGCSGIEDVLPDSPALPAVARWLAGSPANADYLEAALRYWMLAPLRLPGADEAIAALLAALGAAGPDGGEGEE